MINNQLYFGIVEDRNDPLRLGRCRVRVAGLHTHDRIMLPTKDLPWAMPCLPISGGSNAVALAPTPGTQVAVMFADYPDCQMPIVIGVIPHVPQERSVFVNQWPT